MAKPIHNCDKLSKVDERKYHKLYVTRKLTKQLHTERSALKCAMTQHSLILPSTQVMKTRDSILAKTNYRD